MVISLATLAPLVEAVAFLDGGVFSTPEGGDPSRAESKPFLRCSAGFDMVDGAILGLFMAMPF